MSFSDKEEPILPVIEEIFILPTHTFLMYPLKHLYHLNDTHILLTLYYKKPRILMCARL